MTAMTKKLPVSVSYGGAKVKFNEFVIPAMNAGFSGFSGLKSGKLYAYGVLSYLGKEITVNDMFARLVDSGQKIDNVDATLKMLDAYLQEIKDYHIGNVLVVEPSSNAFGFKLRKVAERPNSNKKKLP